MGAALTGPLSPMAKSLNEVMPVAAVLVAVRVPVVVTNQSGLPKPADDEAGGVRPAIHVACDEVERGGVAGDGQAAGGEGQ